jgi:hypothetical protein
MQSPSQQSELKFKYSMQIIGDEDTVQVQI